MEEWKDGRMEEGKTGCAMVSEEGGRMEGWGRREWRKGGDCLNHRLRGLHGFHRLKSLNG